MYMYMYVKVEAFHAFIDHGFRLGHDNNQLEKRMFGHIVCIPEWNGILPRRSFEGLGTRLDDNVILSLTHAQQRVVLLL